jgi:AcrR family transcriptional regulator
MMKTERIYLTKEKIINEAYNYADTHGIDSLSMRILANLLGGKAMSLYNHINNKDTIIDCLIDRVISEIAVPVIGDDWKRAMKKRAVSAHNVLLKHPWATLPMVSRIKTGPAMLTFFDQSLACLHNAGFSLVEADHAINVFDSYIYGFTLIKLNFPIAESDYAKEAKDFESYIPFDIYPSMSGLSKMIIEKTYNGIQDFNFGLEFIIDGLEKSLNEKNIINK